MITTRELRTLQKRSSDVLKSAEFAQVEQRGHGRWESGFTLASTSRLGIRGVETRSGRRMMIFGDAQRQFAHADIVDDVAPGVGAAIFAQ